MPPPLPVDEAAVSERFVRASGPGGQNVNKVATAVELRFDVAASSLADDVKARLIAIAGHRMTEDGVLVIDAREERSQAANREAARARLAAIIRAAMIPPKARRKTRPSAASRERRLVEKKRRGRAKAGRRPTQDGD
jgi:ribosome-associated protein